MKEKKTPRLKPVNMKGMNEDIWAQFTARAKLNKICIAKMFELVWREYARRNK